MSCSGDFCTPWPSHVSYAFLWLATFGGAGLRMDRRATWLANLGNWNSMTTADHFLHITEGFRPMNAGKCYDVPASLPHLTNYHVNPDVSPVCNFSGGDSAGFWFDLMNQLLWYGTIPGFHVDCDYSLVLHHIVWQWFPGSGFDCCQWSRGFSGAACLLGPWLKVRWQWLAWPLVDFNPLVLYKQCPLLWAYHSPLSSSSCAHPFGVRSS